jgi:hypothetical protein
MHFNDMPTCVSQPFLAPGGAASSSGSGLADRRHLLAQHLTVTPSDEAVDEGERIDGPLTAILHLGLVCTEHPVAGAIHFQDHNARRAAG